MKIEIEFTSSYEAAVTIDGKKMRYGLLKGGLWGFGNTLSSDEREDTIGGMVADKISGPLIDILQGWMPSENEYRPDGNCWEAWDKLPDSVANEVYGRINP